MNRRAKNALFIAMAGVLVAFLGWRWTGAALVFNAALVLLFDALERMYMERVNLKRQRAAGVYQYRTVGSVAALDRPMKTHDIPNGFMVDVGGKLLLTEIDDTGRVTDRCVGMSQCSVRDWLSGLDSDTIPADVVVMVHFVDGESNFIVKSIQIDRLFWDGRRMTVVEAFQRRVLHSVVERIWQNYVREVGPRIRREE